MEEADELAAALSNGLSPRAIERLHTHTGGHALYLRTLLTELAPDELAAGDVKPPLSATLAQTIEDRLARLPSDTRKLLEALAVLNTRVPLARVGHLAEVPDPTAALEPALPAGLVEWWPSEASNPIAFRHQLQRDGAYNAIPPTRRRALHAKAALLVDGAASWHHRVAATDTTDGVLAAELETVAAQEAAEGSFGLAATHLLWAGDLHPDRVDRERCALTATVHLFVVGDLPRLLALRETAVACQDTSLRSTALGLIAFTSGNAQEAEIRLREAALTLETGSLAWVPPTAATWLAALRAWQGQGIGTVEAAELALGSGVLPQPVSDLATYFHTVGRSHAEGPGVALPPRIGTEADKDTLVYRGAFNTIACRLPEAEEDLRQGLELAQRGKITMFASLSSQAMSVLAVARYMRGAWTEAMLMGERAVHSAESLEHRWDIARSHLACAMVAAGRGDWTTADKHVGTTSQYAFAGPQEACFAAVAAAVLAQARHDRPAMLAALTPLRDPDVVAGWGSHWALLWRPLLVEALIGVGELAEAETELRELERLATDTPALRPAITWLSAWLAAERGDIAAARAICRRAAEAGPFKAGIPLHQALLEQFHGELLQRQGRSREAEQRLREAYRQFAELDAHPFKERCHDALATCGIPVALTIPTARDGLTEREREVSYLVSRGLTNTEIASKMFVTTKTVEYHLSNVYSRLGIANRRQLRDLIQQEDLDRRSPALANGSAGPSRR
ncbi:LuxR C-terminal-related transcriptional regulator [Lentzea sp. NPDC051208]|uniref:helix-turn-helix transcriptional regulator n=1 Tax=Lentzea sp. NPDC051208 TaxID=3154642 RepID=UPI00343D3F3E